MASVLACVAEWLASGRPLPSGVEECREHADLVGAIACTHRCDVVTARSLKMALAWGARAYSMAARASEVAAARDELRAERAWQSRFGMEQDGEIQRLRAERDALGLEVDVQRVEIDEQRQRLFWLETPAALRDAQERKWRRLQ
jgi:hypothetical protein